MAVAHTFMTSQRKFELSDFNTVVDKSGFNSTFSDREKNRYENVISGNMQLGEALGITGTPGFIIMNMKKPNAATTTFIPGLWTQQLCRAQSKKLAGPKVTFTFDEYGHAGHGRYAFTTSNSSQRVVYLGDSMACFIRKSC